MKNKIDYTLSINRVMDYIDQNYNKSIELKNLEIISGFSKYHFHRLFKLLVNETLYQYINRIRLEKAALKLINSKNTLTNIALEHGFCDGPSFSHAFKKFFLVSPSSYRKDSKNLQDKEIKKDYASDIESFTLLDELIEKKSEEKIAYIRKTGEYKGDFKFFMEPYKKINSWRIKQNLKKDYISKDIIIYHDAISISDKDNLRVSVAATVPSSCKDSMMNFITLLEGDYYVCRFEVDNHGYSFAWQMAYKKVVEHKSLILRDDYAYEHYPKGAYNPVKKSTIVEICLPINQGEY